MNGLLTFEKYEQTQYESEIFWNRNPSGAYIEMYPVHRNYVQPLSNWTRDLVSDFKDWFIIPKSSLSNLNNTFLYKLGFKIASKGHNSLKNRTIDNSARK